MDTPIPPTHDADAVFEEFILAHERGEPDDLDALCRRHAALADELRGLHRAWRRVDAALDRVPPDERGAGGEGSDAPSLDGLRARREAYARYRIGEELGRGGMGVVRSVWDEDLQRHLAMKTIRDLGAGARPDDDARARAVARFLEEGRITGRLEHPGIVPVHDLGLDPDGRLYFTMRRIEGDDLADVFDATARGEDGWTMVRALGVLLRACEAVAFAHDKGVVHRDLKPSNVMVGRFGETYVMDWGLARLKEAAGRSGGDASGTRGGSPLVTRDGDVLGTPAYMPPEQAAGDHEAVGPHSDVYAMGALLYHLLTGIPPYSDGTPNSSRPSRAWRALAADLCVVRRQEPHGLISSSLLDLDDDRSARKDRSISHDRSVDPERIRAPESALFTRDGREESGVTRGGDAESVWTRARVAPPTPVARLAPRQPPELIAICEKAMARRPEHRYPSMVALARDLRAFLEDRVVHAHRTGPWVEFRKWVVRNRALASTLLGSLVLAVAGSTTAAVVLAHKNESIRRAQETAERRSRAATEAQDFLVDLFRSIDPTESAEGRPLTARQLLDRGAERVDEEVSDVGTKSRVLLWIGNAYASLGHAEEAIGVLERALAVASDPEHTCAVRSTLGGALDDLGRTEEGFAMLEDALADAEAHLGESHPSTANIRANLALIHYQEGRLGEAERLNRLVLAADEARGDPPNPRVLTNLSGVYLEQRRFDEAIEVIERAIEVGQRSEKYGPHHIFTLEAERSLGECYLLTKRYEDAAAAWASIFESYVAALGWSHPALTDFVPQLACLESELGRGEDGEERLVRMASALREELGEDDLGVAWVEAHRGVVIERLGRLEEAERLYRRGYERTAEEYGADAPTPTSILHNLVRLLLDQGREEEPRPLAAELRAHLPHGTSDFDAMHERLDALLGPAE